MFSKVGEEQPILKQIVTSISTILPPVVKFMKGKYFICTSFLVYQFLRSGELAVAICGSG